jgi:hypothetical protein
MGVVTARALFGPNKPDPVQPSHNTGTVLPVEPQSTVRPINKPITHYNYSAVLYNTAALCIIRVRHDTSGQWCAVHRALPQPVPVVLVF